jgi:cell division protein ZapE
MANVVGERYRAIVRSGEIEHDPAQERAIDRLSALEARAAGSWLDGYSLRRALGMRRREPPVRGVYLYGKVGRGKTMLMDLFFGATAIRPKRRVHFHEFMLDVHGRIHSWRLKRKRGEVRGEDPIAPVAAQLAAEARLLCLDEFHVDDIADAMILGRLFSGLLRNRVIVVVTSNVPPQELYRDGLNRGLFLPFIALLIKLMDIVSVDARTDFRLEKLAVAPVWLVPANAESDSRIEQIWRRLTGTAELEPREFIVQGRVLEVPRAARGAAWFSFAELCGSPLGSADYVKLAHEFHTLLIDHIPQMSEERRNEAKRFIILIDTLYDWAVKLVATAAAEPGALYGGKSGPEARQFVRTASRLNEMRSQAYLALPHARHRTALDAAVVET